MRLLVLTNSPKGVAVTPDSSFVLVCDSQNDRVQMLRLVVDGNTANLEFFRVLSAVLLRTHLTRASYVRAIFCAPLL
jgi:hypothetical protein